MKQTPLDSACKDASIDVLDVAFLKLFKKSFFWVICLHSTFSGKKIDFLKNFQNALSSTSVDASFHAESNGVCLISKYCVWPEIFRKNYKIWPFFVVFGKFLYTGKLVIYIAL